MNVVQLRPGHNRDDLAKTLRNIADDIDAGACDFDPTMAIVVLAREDEKHVDGDIVSKPRWQTFGVGKGATPIMAKGILAYAMTNWNSER